MRARTYLDTSVISYVTNWPSRDIVTLAHQQITRDWWQRHRANFDLHVSELVLYETGRGDPEAARARLELIADLPVLKINSAARSLADSIFRATTRERRGAEDRKRSLPG